jgi:high affinity sulfate transporter 1
MSLIPPAFRGYRKAWLAGDIVAGVTLAAVAIPETMGYTSIARTPVVSGLYTVILPTALFALIGSSRLLVVGADSATAAILASGLGGLGVAGLTPGSQEWLAYTSLVALICGVLLLGARVLRLGFLGDFLSVSVLIGFLTGVGVQVLTGQIPGMLGLARPEGSWLRRQWLLLGDLSATSIATLGFAVATVAIILAFRRFVPRIPGAVIAVVLSILVSRVIDAGAHGVATVGSVAGGLPRIGLPPGMAWGNVPQVLGIALSCFVLIIAQSAATSRSFALKHGERIDIDRDLIGLGTANLAAGLSGTFVVNGSPTKTEILEDQKARSQIANLVMSLVVLVVVVSATGLLADMPQAVLAGIVFLIGYSLIDMSGLRRLFVRRRSEFVIACVTGAVVVVAGVERGILLAVALSILELVRRQYRPAHFVVSVDQQGQPTYEHAAQGLQSLPGLVVFRYDAQLFFANANRFTDDVESLLQAAPDPVWWLVLDCSSIEDVDYSAGMALDYLIDYVHAHGAHFGITRADPHLMATMQDYGLLDKFGREHVFGNLEDVFIAYRAETDRPGL